MASIKRSSKGLDATDQPPKKVVKTSAPDASIDASVEKLNVANARVESLEKQLEDQSQELYQYFSISGTFRCMLIDVHFTLIQPSQELG